mmetsp:Transcript_9630/g.22901  ORF Transcript_9630/g.22901 Transcript_9630/m.22901 type:complete len:223 (-) Transcript_9630:732-1400(-)
MLLAEERRHAARQQGLRALDRRAAPPQRRRLRPAWVAAQARPRVQPGRRLPASLAGHAPGAVHQGATRQLRHLVQRALHDHQHADQALRRPPVQDGRAREVHAVARRQLQPGHHTRDHVPLARVRELGRQAVRLRLQHGARDRISASLHLRHRVPLDHGRHTHRPGQPLLRLHCGGRLQLTGGDAVSTEAPAARSKTLERAARPRAHSRTPPTPPHTPAARL